MYCARRTSRAHKRGLISLLLKVAILGALSLLGNTAFADACSWGFDGAPSIPPWIHSLRREPPDARSDAAIRDLSKIPGALRR
jgi:hypothetical protein